MRLPPTSTIFFSIFSLSYSCRFITRSGKSGSFSYPDFWNLHSGNKGSLSRSLSRSTFNGELQSLIERQGSGSESFFKNFCTDKIGSKKEHSLPHTEKLDERKTDMEDHLSVHAAHIEEIHEVPMKVLIRPFPPVLDERKVESLMETLENPETADQVPPIDIMWITGRNGGDYYYSFGGCHRYEAYKRLNRDFIPCKVFKSTVNDLKSYLGGSTPDLI